MTRIVRVAAALLLLGAGGLLHAASWQRWAEACPVLSPRDPAACDLVQSHLYDFLVVGEPWAPVGNAAELAGIALLLVAAALLLVPWTLDARASLPTVGGLVALLTVSAIAYADAGLGALRSGLAGSVVEAPLGGPWGALWILVPAPALVWLAVSAARWVRAAAVLLALASPMVMFFTYALGPYDAAPWYEAICGDLTALAGVCLLVAAVRGRTTGRAAEDRVARRQGTSAAVAGDGATPISAASTERQ